ncbi:MAG: hypothetical protein ABW252_06045 [Polyangiales bacterium]
MAPRIAWLLNLGAERELEDPRQDALSPELVAALPSFRTRMRSLLRDHDRVIGIDAALEGCTLALAFCPTPRALARIRAAGQVAAEAPPLAVLARVNGRGFSAALGQTLSGAAYVRDMDALLAVVTRPAADGWLLKRDLSFAGRERRRVQGGALDASTDGFARRSFARGQGLQVEPYVARTDDFALHGYVLPSGAILLGTPRRQHCDARGVWQRGEPLASDALAPCEREALHTRAMRAGEALRAAGYFGPFGIDAFRYLGADGAPAFQPCSELNARFSMDYPRDLLERALGVADAPPLGTKHAD